VHTADYDLAEDQMETSITAGFQMSYTFPIVTRSSIQRYFNLIASPRIANFAPDLLVARPKAFDLGHIET
jgi:hypothetical protein